MVDMRGVEMEKPETEWVVTPAGKVHSAHRIKGVFFTYVTECNGRAQSGMFPVGETPNTEDVCKRCAAKFGLPEGAK